LDSEYENGIVDDDTYQQRRQAYKEQLCRLIEELQRQSKSKGDRDVEKSSVSTNTMEHL
jgi:hypothetical protein